MAEPLIRFSRVRKAFGPKVIYRDLNLEVYPGETVTIMGGSGVGKSVMLKLLIRLLDADAGSIQFHGEEITRLSETRIAGVRQRIAMLFQGGALFDSISVGENVAYGLHEHYRKEMTEAQIAERVNWALSLVGLPGHRADAPGGPLRRHEEARRPRARHRRAAGGAALRRADDRPRSDQHRAHQPPHQGAESRPST